MTTPMQYAVIWHSQITAFPSPAYEWILRPRFSTYLAAAKYGREWVADMEAAELLAGSTSHVKHSFTVVRDFTPVRIEA